MAYIGNTPGENFISFSKQVFTIVNSQTAYSLDHKVTDENELRLVINNVVQEPGTGKAYTASGNTLTLASALTNGTDEMYCIFLGKARETSTVPDSFITKNKLNLISTSSSAGLEVKGDGSSQDGYLQLNCSQNSHGVKIKSPSHSAGQSYTLTLPSSISADTFLKTDGSGNLSFAAAASAGEANDPSFHVYNPQNGSVSNNTSVVVSHNTELFDSSSAYDTSTYRFTPQVGGYYYFYCSVRFQSGTNDFDRINVAVRKNGTEMISGRNDNKDYNTTHVSGLILANGSSDYFDMTAYHTHSSALNISTEDELVYFGGFLIKKT